MRNGMDTIVTATLLGTSIHPLGLLATTSSAYLILDSHIVVWIKEGWKAEECTRSLRKITHMCKRWLTLLVSALGEVEAFSISKHLRMLGVLSFTHYLMIPKSANRVFASLTQYKNYFLAWDARLSDKSDFETVYSVFRLRIPEIKRKFRKDFQVKSSDYYTIDHTKWTVASKILLIVSHWQLQLFHVLFWHEFMSKHEIIADTSFIFTVCVVVEQLWKYFAIQISITSDMKTC